MSLGSLEPLAGLMVGSSNDAKLCAHPPTPTFALPAVLIRWEPYLFPVAAVAAPMVLVLVAISAPILLAVPTVLHLCTVDPFP